MKSPEPGGILRKLESQLTAADSLFTSRFPVSRYITALDRRSIGHRYNDVPPEVTLICSQIAAQFSLTVLETYQKFVIATLISDFDRRVRQKRLPGIAVELYSLEFERILREVDTNPPGFYLLDNDLFLKDLGLCRTVLIPAGVEFVHEWSGVPRSIFWKAGVAQSLRAFRLFFLEQCGFKPFYEIHMDPRRRDIFGPETRAFCYRLVAELLLSNPGIKGMIGGSWFYDPALEKVSPRLTYLRKVPMDHGARVFFYRAEDSTSGALLRSETRRRSYAEGRYQPKSYILVWPREHIIRWAAGFGRLQLDHLPDRASAATEKDSKPLNIRVSPREPA